MIESQNIRQILAIMVTDIVDYTETMNNDEAKAHLGLDENDKANECLTKLLGIWENADADYIYYQEAKKLWKELNMEKAAVA